MREEIIKRIKSFVWRLLGMASVAGLAFFSQNLDIIETLPLSPEVKGLLVIIAGLVVGETTKWLNNRFELEDKAIGAIKRLGKRA